MSSHARWQGTGLVVAVCLVSLGVFLGSRREREPGLVVSLASTSPAGSSTSLRFRVSVPLGVHVGPGDTFRVVDVPGYVSGSALAPDGWKAEASASHASLTDLVFVRDAHSPLIGPTLLRGFSLRSTSGRPRSLGGFVGRCTRLDGSSLSSRGDIAVPGAVPEPAGVVSGTVGVLILGVVYASRHRRKVRLGG